LTEPSALSIAISGEIDVSCFSFADGTITADANGGTPINGIPPQYTYAWSHGFTNTVAISTANNLSPGIYTVTATDANGCTITAQSVYITEPGHPLSISVDSTDEACGNDGEAIAFVLGGTEPYAYAWNTAPSQTTNPATNLAPGVVYTVNVTDANGCTISDETFVNGSSDIFLPGNLTSIDTTVCLGTSVSLPIQVKPTLFYVWMYNNDTIYSANSNYYTDITVTPTAPDNVYTLYITDPNCANPYTVTATIHLPAPVDPLISSVPPPEMINGYLEAHIEVGKSIDVFSNNMDCDTYVWWWNTIPPDSDSIPLPAQRVITDYPDVTGWYYIAVDSAGCLGSDSLKVVVGIRIYDAITPNGDGSNDVWNMPGIAYYPNALIQVFNRWGALVHETSGGGLDYIAWDGTRGGSELPVGTYYYIIDLDNGNAPQTGPITIIR
jgi:gliding motility-associated-like protein